MVESNKAMSLILVEPLDVCVCDHTSVLSRHIFIFTKVVRMKIRSAFTLTVIVL